MTLTFRLKEIGGKTTGHRYLRGAERRARAIRNLRPDAELVLALWSNERLLTSPLFPGGGPWLTVPDAITRKDS